MKKFLLVLATTGLVMTGCSQSEIIGEAPEAQTGKIGFASHVNKGTRTLDNTTFNTFKVFGVYTMPNETNSPIIVFNDVTVTKDGDTWKYDDPRYWVPTASYRFSAYSVENGLPTGARANYIAGNDHVYQLNINGYLSDKDNQKDLVYASTTAIQGKDKENAQVALQFGHILSRIQLQFISNFPAGYNVEISNVRVNNIRNTGNFLGASKTWDEVERTKNNITVEPQFPVDKNICSAANGEENPAVNATTEFVYVIPFEYTSANVDFFFDITVYNSNIKIFENSLKAQLKPNWEINKQYRYNITLTGTAAGLEPIEFTGSVTEWDTNINDVDAGNISAGELPTEND